jgi:hypothetical protein
VLSQPEIDGLRAGADKAMEELDKARDEEMRRRDGLADTNRKIAANTVGLTTYATRAEVRAFGALRVGSERVSVCSLTELTV